MPNSCSIRFVCKFEQVMTTDAVNPAMYSSGYPASGYPAYAGPYNTGDIQYGLPTEQPQPAEPLKPPDYTMRVGAELPSVYQSQQLQPVPTFAITPPTNNGLAPTGNTNIDTGSESQSLGFVPSPPPRYYSPSPTPANAR